MSIDHVLYVTQESLSVWSLQKGVPTQFAEFRDDADGLAEFDTFAARNSAFSVAILTDLIEEEFAIDPIPKLGRRDRDALLKRRANKKFRRAKYRISIFQGRAQNEDDEYVALHCAISNAELLEPWIACLERNKVPLSGIFSVPTMTTEIISELVTSKDSLLFVAPHQNTRVRQVFVRNGQLQTARLSGVAGDKEDNYARSAFNEAQRSLRYLERTRLIGNHETLDVYVVGDKSALTAIAEEGDFDPRVNFHVLDSGTVAKKLGLNSLQHTANFELAYVSRLFRRRYKFSYAKRRDTRYWRMRRIRSGIMAASVAAAVCCSALAAVFVTDAWVLRQKHHVISQQVNHLSESYRRENELFMPIKANSHEMKLAVDTGDYILANRVPVPWVFNQLGAVLGDYPNVRVVGLRWSLEAAAASRPPARRGNQPMPIAIQEATTLKTVLIAELTPFDGNLRDAFTRIDEFASTLQSRTAFTEVVAAKYPFDPNTAIAISGEVGAMQNGEAASFELRLRYAVPTLLAQRQDAGNDET